MSHQHCLHHIPLKADVYADVLKFLVRASLEFMLRRSSLTSFKTGTPSVPQSLSVMAHVLPDRAMLPCAETGHYATSVAVQNRTNLRRKNR